MGIRDADDETIAEILRRVKEKGMEKRGLVDDAEFREIVESVLISSTPPASSARQ
jgi:hypothetical protein